MYHACADICVLSGFAVTGAYAADNKKASTPWLNMVNGDGQPYVYSQTGYYQDGYVFEMGWNLNEKGYNAYPDRTTLTLADKFKITVSFDAICKNSIQQPEALTALSALLDRLKTQSEATGVPLEKPLVVGVEYVGNKDVSKLAEEYYNDGESTSLSAIFFALDKKTQQFYFNKMFDDGKIALFSAILKTNEISDDMVNQFAKKAYSEDKLITFFSVLVPYMTDSEKQAWVVKSSQDKRVTFLSVLKNEISKQQQPIFSNANDSAKTTWDFGEVPRCNVKVASENIVVKTGSDSFKIEVDEASKNSYTFTDGIHTTSKKREITFKRKTELKPDAVYSSTIYVTIPKNDEQNVLCFISESGNVSVDGLNCSALQAESQSGNVNIFNTKTKILIAKSETGEVDWQNTTADRILSNKRNSDKLSISPEQIALNKKQYTYLTELKAGSSKSERVMFKIDNSSAFLYLEMEDYSEPVGIKVYYGNTNQLVFGSLGSTFVEGGIPGFLIDCGVGTYSVELIDSNTVNNHRVALYGVSTEKITDYENIALPNAASD